jgi:tetratricopeptide (TPR) repeat protein
MFRYAYAKAQRFTLPVVSAGALSAVLLLIIGLASADPIADCNQQEDPDRRIRGCTQFIQHPASEKSSLAAAYVNRGNAYHSKGEYDQAIADYGKAIQLNPKYAEAYNNRGAAHEKKQDKGKAIADYRMALSLNPSSPGGALAKNNLQRLGAGP